MSIVATKCCSRCCNEKPQGKFNKDRSKKDGLSSRCIDCSKEINAAYYKEKADKIRAKAAEYRRANSEKVRKFMKVNHLRTSYGLSLEEVERLAADQNHSCKCCKTPASSLPKGLFVDHCHKTGVVRGLLCQKCNMGLGLFNDNVELLRGAIEYLDGSRNEQAG